MGTFNAIELLGRVKGVFYSWAFDHIRTLGLKAQAPNQFDNSSGQSIFMNKQFATADSY